MKNSLTKIFATWFYLGHLPKFPGTWGTLGALPLVFLGFHFLSPLAYLGATLGFVLLSILISEKHQSLVGGEDPKEIVIDEVAGFLITMALIPWSLLSVVLGFVLFRGFDILKPFPINYVEKRLAGGLGVVADDILAGVFANLLLHTMYSYTNWLG